MFLRIISLSLLLLTHLSQAMQVSVPRPVSEELVQHYALLAKHLENLGHLKISCVVKRRDIINRSESYVASLSNGSEIYASKITDKEPVCYFEELSPQLRQEVQLPLEKDCFYLLAELFLKSSQPSQERR